MTALNIRKTLFKNMSFQVLSHVFSMGLGMVSIGILSRYLGVDAFGQLNYLFAFYYFFMVLNDLGIDVVVTREISQHPERADHIIGAMRTLKVALSLILMLAAWIFIRVMRFDPALRDALTLFGFMLPILALQSSSVIFSAKLKMEYGAVIGWVNRIVHFTLVIVFVANGYGLWAFALTAILCELVSMGLIFLFARNYIHPRWGFDAGIYKKIFRSSIPIAITGIFVAVLNRIDFIMLERMTTIHEVGLYSASYKITNLAETLPSMIMATISPLMSRYAEEDRQELKRIYNKSNLLFTSIAIPMGIIVSLTAPFLERLFFGSQFIQSCHGLRVLIWASVCIYMALPGGQLLISTGHEKISLYLNMAAAAMNITLNFILIPKLSFVGAALATSLCYLFLMTGTRIAAWKILKDFQTPPPVAAHL